MNIKKMLNLASRPLTFALGILFLFLQYELWSSNGGLGQVIKTKQAIALVQEQNKELHEKNLVLTADVEDLRKGDESIEEHARLDLGMIKKDEIFYQLVD